MYMDGKTVKTIDPSDTSNNGGPSEANAPDAYKPTTVVGENTPKDAYALTAGRYVWPTGNVTINVPMPSDREPDTPLGWKKTPTTAEAIDVFGSTSIAGITVGVDHIEDGYLTATVTAATYKGNEAYLCFDYIKKGTDDETKSFKYKLPVVSPNVVLSATNTADGQKVQAAINGAAAKQIMVGGTGVTTSADLSSANAGTATDAASTTTACLALQYVSGIGSGASGAMDATKDICGKPAQTGAGVTLGTGDGTITIAAKQPGSAVIKLVEGHTTAGLPLCTLGIKVEVSGKVTVTPDTYYKAVTATYATAAVEDGTAAKAANAAVDNSKTIWLGSAGTAADVKLTFASKDAATKTWAVTGGQESNTAFADNVLTIDKGEVGTTGELAVTCKDANSGITGTYTVKVAKWPTLELGMVTTAHTASTADGKINNSTTADFTASDTTKYDVGTLFFKTNIGANAGKWQLIKTGASAAVTAGNATAWGAGAAAGGTATTTGATGTAVVDATATAALATDAVVVTAASAAVDGGNKGTEPKFTVKAKTTGGSEPTFKVWCYDGGKSSSDKVTLTVTVSDAGAVTVAGDQAVAAS